MVFHPSRLILGVCSIINGAESGFLRSSSRSPERASSRGSDRSPGMTSSHVVPGFHDSSIPPRYRGMYVGPIDDPPIKRFRHDHESTSVEGDPYHGEGRTELNSIEFVTSTAARSRDIDRNFEVDSNDLQIATEAMESEPELDMRVAIGMSYLNQWRSDAGLPDRSLPQTDDELRQELMEVESEVSQDLRHGLRASLIMKWWKDLQDAAQRMAFSNSSLSTDAAASSTTSSTGGSISVPTTGTHATSVPTRSSETTSNCCAWNPMRSLLHNFTQSFDRLSNLTRRFAGACCGSANVIPGEDSQPKKSAYKNVFHYLNKQVYGRNIKCNVCMTEMDDSRFPEISPACSRVHERETCFECMRCVIKETVEGWPTRGLPGILDVNCCSCKVYKVDTPISPTIIKLVLEDCDNENTENGNMTRTTAQTLLEKWDRMMSVGAWAKTIEEENKTIPDKSQHRQLYFCSKASCPGAADAVNDSFAQCNVCNDCIRCGRKPHKGQTCQQVYDEKVRNLEAEKKSIAEIAENTRPCPKCKKPIHRTGGCDHMTCIQGCSHEFWWCCGQQFFRYDVHHYDGICRNLQDWWREDRSGAHAEGAEASGL